MNHAVPGRPTAVLLDWDNTLVDTWHVIHDAMNTTLIAMGEAEWTIEQTRARVRRALREAFPDLFGPRWEEARDIFYKRFRAIHLDKLEPRPGAGDLLAALAEQDVYLGVVSNKQGDHLRAEARHLGWDGYFGRVIGATDAGIDKPAPEVVHLALEGSGIAAGQDVWFVGDTGIDMECAHNSLCVPVLLREAAPSGDEFGEFEPKMHFRNCEDLATLVKTL